jgi:FkbM family methyltransferase
LKNPPPEATIESNMKPIIKRTVARVADALNALRGYRFPDYFNERDRVKVLLFGIEPDVSRFLKDRLEPGMTVVDIGGNVGLICRICAKQVGPGGRVWSFEPDPHTRSYLEHNVRRCPNVTVSPIALSDENATAKLHIHPASGTANSLLSFEASSHAVDVECMTLDSFLDANPGISPDCVKIDVEGAEPKVLRGMRKTIHQFRNLFIVIEFCPQNLANGGYTARDFFDLLVELGLSAEIIGDNGRTSPVDDLEDLLAKLGDEIYCNLLCHARN